MLSSAWRFSSLRGHQAMVLRETSREPTKVAFLSRYALTFVSSPENKTASPS
ncbi:hypothetical protein BCR44DRAFT_1436118, partial [Catenaria anguillulae PL171]